MFWWRFTVKRSAKMRDNLKYVLLLLASVAGILLVWYFSSIVLFIAVAAVISLVVRPIFQALRGIRFRKKSLGNGICAFITLLILWVFIGLFFFSVIPLIANEFQFLSSVDVPKALQKLIHMLSEVLAPLRRNEMGVAMLNSFEEQFKNSISALFDFNRLRDFFASIAGFVGGMFIAAFSITFITFFFLKDESLLTKGFLLFLPNRYESGLTHAFRSIRFLLRRYFLGIFIQTCLIFILVTSGFSILGLAFSHAAIIGLVSGLLNVVPYLGPLIGASFGITVGSLVFLQGARPTAFFAFLSGMILVYTITHLLDNMVFQPLIFSNSVKAHPLEIFIVILISGYLVGIVGMFLAIPVYTILRVIAREFFNNYKVINKLTGHL